jgi:hypothetical protein
MTPIKKNLIDVNMLDNIELEWLNTYHRQVRENLLPLMTELFPESVDYLIQETEPLLK